MNSRFFRAVFLLIGTIIGAGIFALPFAFMLSGSLFSILGLVALGLVTLIINLFYAQIIVKTSGDHQLAGYVERYLGRKYKWLAVFSLFLICWGASLAYVILGGDFLGLAFGQASQPLFSLLFWCWGAFLIWGGIKTISLVESWLSLLLVGACLLLPVLGSPFFRKENLILPAQSSFAFCGPALFALSGLSVIPEAEEILRKKRSLLPLAIFWGVLIPVVVYLVFVLGILGVSGGATSVDALSGLLYYSPALVKIGALAGVLATFTSFLSLGNVLRELFFQDLKWSVKSARFWAVFSSLPAVCLPLFYFLPIISLTGSLAIGLASFLVLFIFLKRFAQSLPEKLLAWAAGLVLLGGIVSSLV
ncbi:MAG: aromatic amino acid transport family protein [Candidatus Shapirobacteria bacterium]